MSEKTVFAREDFEEVADRYNLGSVEGEPVLEKGGLVNYNFCVDTSSGKYMFRTTGGLSDNKVSRRNLEHAVTEHLSNSDFPYESPVFLSNNNNEKITRIGEKTFEVYKRVLGEAGSSRGGEDANESIRMIAEYHKAMKDFSMDSVSDDAPAKYDESGWIRNEWEKIREKVQNPSNSADELIRDKIDKIIGAYDLVKNTATPNRPNIFVHGDLHPGNMIYEDGKITGLIDFGNTKWGTKEQDLYRVADCEPEEFSSRIEEYRKFNNLDDNEASNVLPESIMHRLGAIRWAYSSMKKDPGKRDELLKGMIGGFERVVNNYEKSLSVAA